MPVVIFVILILVASTLAHPCPRNVSYPFSFVTREEWGARPAGYTTPLTETPVPFVVIHHSYIPPACDSTTTCIEKMQYIQDMHQIDNGWEDLGYNFAVGGDSAVYEGRGWQHAGAHVLGYNFNSMGIVLIGDFISQVPPAEQLESAKALIEVGVNLGYIRADYRLIGHRQATATECPGQALYNEITGWEHFVPQP